MTRYLQVHLIEEAPAIGTGRRQIEIVSVGRKWARIRCPFTGRTAKLAIDTWRSIEASAVPTRIRQKILKRCERDRRRLQRERKLLEQLKHATDNFELWATKLDRVRK